MKRWVNIVNYIITLAITLGLLFLAVFLCSGRYGGTMFQAALKFLVGAIIAGLLCTVFHEVGHLLIGKKNGFVFSSMTIWFFNWTKRGKNTDFNFVMIGDEAGYTEMIPTKSDNLSKRLKNMTYGGIWASFLFMILGIPSLFITALPVWVFCIWSMFLPVGAYFFVGSILPTSSYGVLNDGGVIYSLNRKNDVSKVIVNMLEIQSEMYNGKTPSEIDESLYFSVPQLPEDSIYFAGILSYRYMFYLDKEDFENAKKVTERLLSLSEYFPKTYLNQIKSDALFNACTFDFDEERADDLVYEIEKYLNNVNNSNNIRSKMAYIAFVTKDNVDLNAFYKKGVREAKKCLIKGLAEYELKLLDKVMEKYNALSDNDTAKISEEKTDN